MPDGRISVKTAAKQATPAVAPVVATVTAVDALVTTLTVLVEEEPGGPADTVTVEPSIAVMVPKVPPPGPPPNAPPPGGVPPVAFGAVEAVLVAALEEAARRPR